MHKLSQRGFQGYPLATICYYGPTAERASKVAVGIIRDATSEVDTMQRWFSEEEDARHDPVIGAEILHFIRQHGVRSVVLSPGIIGCPHEEGIDYPEGQKCPQCPYWANRDRFTNERIQ